MNPLLKEFKMLQSELNNLDAEYLSGIVERGVYLENRQELKNRFTALKKIGGF